QSPHIDMAGKTFLNFSSNDYLGLANDPALKEAAVRAIEKFGVGSGSSRLICGSIAPFHELEESLAVFKKTQAALTFSSGYATAVGTICALLGKNDIIVLDKLVHACIVDAAKLSGAKIRVFAHNDLNDLEKKLKWAKEGQSRLQSQILVVTESIFSMDGDAALLREIVELKNRFGAWLMVDEAHATGIFGKNGRGLADEFGVSNQIEIQMGTLGKSLGSSGGYICGSRHLIDFLVNRARSLIFSTAPMPASAAAAAAAIQLLQSDDGNNRRQILQERISQFQSAIGCRPSAIQSAIVPIILGDEAKTISAAAKLREQNIYVPGIRFPSVARGAARLRVTLSAAHSADDISQLISALNSLDE
ncbi:MAG TPA: 8-amino-7-oxononanoate synthase, partial [Verrucomicrobiae bacterium]|nr:8-amino-7-oxononanoate synthase [Verrucomicrobiae bacterium]